MQIFDRYIAKHEIAPLVKTKSHSSVTGLVVVIPCFNEPAIEDTLNALLRCDFPDCRTEVLIVVNSGETTSDEIVNRNRQTYFDLLAFKERNNNSNIGFSPVLVQNIRKKHAGVGMARKIGMDQAVLLFNREQCEDGIIVSLDADTLVEKNYLKVIYERFNSERLDLATIDFLHQLDGDQFDSEIYQAITLYELHLRFVRLALEVARYPYVMHTVGSAFAVRADAYASHGGMNRKQGGEDFYFLHKLRPHVRYAEITETCVHPSPRPSARVPFGTGPQVIELQKTHEMNTYDLNAFMDLKLFVSMVPDLFNATKEDYENFLLQMPNSVREFLVAENFYESVKEVNANAKDEKAFEKRLFQNFNAFKVVKYLNTSHTKDFEKQDVRAMCEELFAYFGISEPGNSASDYLIKLRSIEQSFNQAD